MSESPDFGRPRIKLISDGQDTILVSLETGEVLAPVRHFSYHVGEQGAQVMLVLDDLPASLVGYLDLVVINEERGVNN